jgi:hypothetical protein
MTNKTKINKTMNFLLLISLFLIFILSLSQLTFAKELNDEEEITLTLNDYYSSYMKEDLESYYKTISTTYKTEKLLEKREITQYIWAEFDTIAYSIKNIVINKRNDISIVEYFLSSKVQDSKGEVVMSERDMIAIFFKENNIWKIWATMPKVTFDARMAAYGQELDLTCKEECNLEYSEDNLWNKITGIFTSKEKIEYYEEKEGICGNKICENNETTYICPSDCFELTFCQYDVMKFKELENISMQDLPSLGEFLINNKNIKLIEDDQGIQGMIWYFTIKDGKIDFLEPQITYEEFCIADSCRQIRFFGGDFALDNNKIDYTITMSSCTASQLVDNSDLFMDLYNTGKIKISGVGFFDKTKVFISTTLLKIINLFNGDDDDEEETDKPVELVQKEDSFIYEVENCELFNPGQYSFIGKTSRGLGELYLGTGSSYAECKFVSQNEGKYYTYLYISDDALHVSGARDAEIYVNGIKYDYKHISRNTITQESAWGYDYLAEIEIKEGENTLKIVKPRQTSAAFVLDKIEFTTKRK